MGLDDLLEDFRYRHLLSWSFGGRGRVLVDYPTWCRYYNSFRRSLCIARRHLHTRYKSPTSTRVDVAEYASHTPQTRPRRRPRHSSLTSRPGFILLSLVHTTIFSFLDDIPEYHLINSTDNPIASLIHSVCPDPASSSLNVLYPCTCNSSAINKRSTGRVTSLFIHRSKLWQFCPRPRGRTRR